MISASIKFCSDKAYYPAVIKYLTYSSAEICMFSLSLNLHETKATQKMIIKFYKKRNSRPDQVNKAV